MKTTAEMVSEAGLTYPGWSAAMERFADLVREQYREELLADTMSFKLHYAGELSLTEQVITAQDAHNLLAAAVLREREECAGLIEGYQIPVGNSSAGELACQWTYDALKKILNQIRKVKEPS